MQMTLLHATIALRVFWARHNWKKASERHQAARRAYGIERDACVSWLYPAQLHSLQIPMMVAAATQANAAPANVGGLGTAAAAAAGVGVGAEGAAGGGTDPTDEVATDEEAQEIEANMWANDVIDKALDCAA